MGWQQKHGKAKGRKVLEVEQKLTDLSSHRQVVHIHSAVKEGLETVFLNQFQLATVHLHLNLSFPKVRLAWDRAESSSSSSPRSASALGAS